MTDKEAIATLKGEKWICCAEKWNEAIEKAVTALEQMQKIQILLDMDNGRRTIKLSELKEVIE